MIRCRLAPVFLLATACLGELFTSTSRAGDPAQPAPERARYPRSASPLGFAPGSRPRQLEAEAAALAVPTPENARKWLRTLTAEPHVAGTPADHKTALFVRDMLREWGWKADLVPYEVLLNYPRNPPSLQINRPDHKSLVLDEAPLSTDKDSASTQAFPAFHGYGISGTAAGQVVYANYARPDDFAALDKLGISVRDKIVLARYGGNFRGLKVLNAQKHGARGILIYSDPGDDGYAKGDVYPAGPFRPGSAVQRGSVQFLSLGPGDPSTPHGPSIKGADRLPFHPFDGFPTEKSSITFLSDSTRTLPRQGMGSQDRPQARRLLRHDPLAADQLRRGEGDPPSACRPQRALGLARGPAAGLPRGTRSRGGRSSRSRWTTRSARSGT